MDARLERTITVGRAVFHELRTEKVTFMAGSIAYHAVVSLLPLLLLSLGLLSILGDATLQHSFTHLIRTAFTPEVADLLVKRLDGASSGLSILSVVVLLWGTLRIFRSLDQAFSAIYETESRNSLPDQFTDGVVVLVTFGLAIAAGWAINTALSGYGSGPPLRIVRWAVLVAGLSVAFLPMYYVFPDTDVSIREILPGLVFAAVGIAVFESVFHFYTTFKSPGSIVTDLLVLLTWLYVSALILLVGAALNAVLANRSDDVNLRPVIGGVEPDPDESAPAANDQLIARLRRIEATAANAESLVVVADGTEISLPPPRSVLAATHSTDDATARLELQWRSDTVGRRWWNIRWQ